MSKIIDLCGQRFGRLTVLELTPLRPVHFRCRCDCGAIVNVLSMLLRDGRTRSCGCLRREVTAAKMRTHGFAPSGKRPPEYSLWLNIKQRCTNPAVAHYQDYGGRGITVCDRWRSFENFYADMGPRPDTVPGSRKRSLYSLDRIDNNGPYSPENCRWATQHQQTRNKRTNRFVTYDGHTLTIKDWADRMGVDEGLIRHRLNIGWTPERAITLRPQRSRFGSTS